MEFDVARDLPPPIAQLNGEERAWLAEALAAAADSDGDSILWVLQGILESRISEQEFEDYLLFEPEDQQAILQRVADQLPELDGMRIKRPAA